MEQFHLLLRRRSAGEKAAEDLHGGRFQIGCEKKTAFTKSPLEPIEEPIKVSTTGGSMGFRAIGFLSVRNRTGGTSPFPSKKQDTLGEIEGAEIMIGLESHHYAGACNHRIIQTGCFRAEDNGDLCPARAPRSDSRGGVA